MWPVNIHYVNNDDMNSLPPRDLLWTASTWKLNINMIHAFKDTLKKFKHWLKLKKLR